MYQNFIPSLNLKEMVYIEQIYGFVEWDHKEEMVIMLKVQLV